VRYASSYGIYQQEWDFSLPVVLVKGKSYLVLKIVTKSLNKVRLEMWFVGENESFNARFI
jgi:hypothetical protein